MDFERGKMTTPTNPDGELRFRSDFSTDLTNITDFKELMKILVLAAHHCGNWQKPFTLENLQPFLDKMETLIAKETEKARIDELKRITKETIEKPITPENKNDATWQGGYNFARNSLKRYKLNRIKQLNQQSTGDKDD